MFEHLLYKKTVIIVLLTFTYSISKIYFNYSQHNLYIHELHLHTCNDIKFTLNYLAKYIY